MPSRACSVIFCEAVAIYGVIVAIILQTHLDPVDPLKFTEVTPKMKYAGYAIFWSGLTAGLGNLSCGCVPLAARADAALPSSP